MAAAHQLLHCVCHEDPQSSIRKALAPALLFSDHDLQARATSHKAFYQVMFGSRPQEWAFSKLHGVPLNSCSCNIANLKGCTSISPVVGLSVSFRKRFTSPTMPTYHSASFPMRWRQTCTPLSKAQKPGFQGSAVVENPPQIEQFTKIRICRIKVSNCMKKRTIILSSSPPPCWPVSTVSGSVGSSRMKVHSG